MTTSRAMAVEANIMYEKVFFEKVNDSLFSIFVK